MKNQKKVKVTKDPMDNLVINESKVSEILSQDSRYQWIVIKSLERMRDGLKLGLNTKNFLVLVGVLESK